MQWRKRFGKIHTKKNAFLEKNTKKYFLGQNTCKKKLFGQNTKYYIWNKIQWRKHNGFGKIHTNKYNGDKILAQERMKIKKDQVQHMNHDKSVTLNLRPQRSRMWCGQDWKAKNSCEMLNKLSWSRFFQTLILFLFRLENCINVEKNQLWIQYPVYI